MRLRRVLCKVVYRWREGTRAAPLNNLCARSAHVAGTERMIGEAALSSDHIHVPFPVCDLDMVIQPVILK
jgi:hypothetical protein